MSASMLTLLGALGAALIAGAVSWGVNHRSRDERDAVVSKTNRESDTGVVVAADQMLDRMHKEYEFLADQLKAVRAELQVARDEHRALRQDLAEVRTQLAEVRADRDALRGSLAAVGAELANVRADRDLLRQRVDELEARATRNEGDHQ